MNLSRWCEWCCSQAFKVTEGYESNTWHRNFQTRSCGNARTCTYVGDGPALGVKSNGGTDHIRQPRSFVLKSFVLTNAYHLISASCSWATSEVLSMCHLPEHPQFQNWTSSGAPYAELYWR